MQLASDIQLLVYVYVFIVFAPVACMFCIIEILCISIRAFRGWNSWLKKENVSNCKIVIGLFLFWLNPMAVFSRASPSAPGDGFACRVPQNPLTRAGIFASKANRVKASSGSLSLLCGPRYPRVPEPRRNCTGTEVTPRHPCLPYAPPPMLLLAL